MAFPRNTIEDKVIDLTKYSKVYTKTGGNWKLTSYSCRKCLMKFSTYGRLEKHPNACPGAPTSQTFKE